MGYSPRGGKELDTTEQLNLIQIRLTDNNFEIWVDGSF